MSHFSLIAVQVYLHSLVHILTIPIVPSLLLLLSIFISYPSVRRLAEFHHVQLSFGDRFAGYKVYFRETICVVVS